MSSTSPAIALLSALRSPTPPMADDIVERPCPPPPPPPPDWTDDIPDSDHLRFFKSVDWAATLLGPLSTWSLPLKLHAYQCFADTRPAVIYWGPDKVAVYNESFVPLAGAAHPALMGATFQQAFPEIWEDIMPVFDAACATRKAVDAVELPLMVERSGYLEETYFTGNFTPLCGLDGHVAGYYNALVEVTKQKLDDRRAAMLNLVHGSIETPYTHDLGSHFIDALCTNPLDIPLALLYQIDDESAGPHYQLSLRGSIGLPEHHPLAVARAALDSQVGIMPLLCKAQSDVLTLPAGDLFAGVKWAGHDQPSTSVSIVPLSNAGRSHGFLLVGANPRRPCDEQHHKFMQNLSRQLSATISFTIGQEELTKRQGRLENDLAESERHIRYMAQHSLVGMEQLTMDGELVWANEQYYALLGTAPDALGRTNKPFVDAVDPAEDPQIQDAWARLIRGDPEVSLELRLKRRYTPPTGEPIAATVLTSSFPYWENGQIKSIMSCITDVSRMKWAESWQARIAQEAQDAKRQQSEFTDAISHEVRNPLSAILQLADSISTSLDLCRSQGDLSLETCTQALRENVEAAEAILLCANHQKRVVDDVLTLSKMDFMLVSLSPTGIRPTDLANETLKILGAQVMASDVSLKTIAHSSLTDLAIDEVLCDALRVKQIVLNLLSNALKFTKGEQRREITLTYGAALSDPKQSLPKSLYWAPSKQVYEDVTVDDQWGSGEPVYLTFSVEDTGPGMTDEELHLLFNRFQQANPRTTIEYGGSGLGLFISHKLAEKHGGGIGVSSQPGQGSTFAFFIKTRRKVNDPGSPSLAGHDTPVGQLTLDLNPKPIDPAIMLAGIHLQESVTAKPDSLHVLLVEDNLLNQRVLRKQLTKRGCIVHVANHGLEALDELKLSSRYHGKATTGNRIDIVLLDWEMPVMNGLDCAREIRAMEKTGELAGHVETIAITANARQEQIELALAAGIDDVMPKPFVVADLLVLIDKRLGR